MTDVDHPELGLHAHISEEMIKINAALKQDITAELRHRRGISARGLHLDHIPNTINAAQTVLHMASNLRGAGHDAEADALDTVYQKMTDLPSFGGLGLDSNYAFNPKPDQYREIMFLVQAWLKSIEYDKPVTGSVSKSISDDRVPMTMAEKIFYQHMNGGYVPPSGIQAGHVIRASIDWILSSELSWAIMSRCHEEMGSPGIWRNDRFWLAGDHAVHPSITQVPKIKAFIEGAEKARQDFKMTGKTEYQGMNFTIMHTEFLRERAEPGMLILGADSHTCSSGAVGCLSIGLGTADIMMALSLGETWFKVPDSIRIELTGKPNFGITGKDVILYILQQLKRNTVAAERIVEFGGEGTKYLSIDARFAICNMCTEFGAITGVFIPDDITHAYIQSRRSKKYKSHSLYFEPDLDAHYVDRYSIDLSKIQPGVAVYPEPDHVVAVSEMASTQLDGIFIGACTTTEEEFVLAGLILQAGLKKKLPLAKGKRHYVPGSLPMVEGLRKIGMLDIFEQAGFSRGPPGCSMCVGLTAEKASAGETWLSSQNRNFKNRMGPGAYGHVSSAAVCAASAFSMNITSPEELLRDIDVDFLTRYLKIDDNLLIKPEFVEPLAKESNRGVTISDRPNSKTFNHHEIAEADTAADIGMSLSRTNSAVPKANGNEAKSAAENLIIKSKVITLGDFIDTDALAPGESLTNCVTDGEYGQYVMKFVYPEFREKVKSGMQVVVAGKAFGVGSSREVAVNALKGAGVKAVIAKSFAFIYGRNQPSLGLLGFAMNEDTFYERAKDGTDIEIDVNARVVTVDGQTFPFTLSDIEYNLTMNNGLAQCYKQFGRRLWEHLTTHADDGKQQDQQRLTEAPQPTDNRLAW